MTKTMAHGYSSDSTQRELSNEHQHDRVLTIFKKLCVLVLRTKIAFALERLRGHSQLVACFKLVLGLSVLYCLHLFWFEFNLEPCKSSLQLGLIPPIFSQHPFLHFDQFRMKNATD